MNKFKFAAILAAGAVLALSPAHVAAQGEPPFQLELHPEGAQVVAITDEGAVSELGLNLDDIVLEVGGQPMSPEVLMVYMQSKKEGDPVAFKVRRAGVVLDVTGRAPAVSEE